MSDGNQQSVLPNGGEIHFTDDRDPHSADRIEYLPGGHVKAIYKRQYEMEIYPPHIIEGVYTFTKHVEDAEWW